RQQADDQATSTPLDEPTTAEETTPVEEPVVEEPTTVEEPVAKQADPLTDPLPAEEPAAQAQVAEPVHDEPVLDENDPLGLGLPTPAKPVIEEPVVEEPVVEEPAAQETVTEQPPAASLDGGLPTRTRGAADEINRDMPGLPPTR